jgi:hypothetical protein
MSNYLKNFKDGCPIKNVGHDNYALSSPPVLSGDPSVEDVSGETAGVRGKMGTRHKRWILDAIGTIDPFTS